MDSCHKKIQGMSIARLEELLNIMKTRRAVLIGDMCLDVYWFADMTRSKLSGETPHFPLPVVEEKMSAGAGGNVVVNLSTLCDNVTPVGIMGNDWRGQCLYRIFQEKGIPTDFLFAADGRMTNAYCKPLRRGFAGVDVEDPRIDFEAYLPPDPALENELLVGLEKACQCADVLCVSDQFEFGCVSERIRDRINQLAGEGLLTVVDSRSRIMLYRNCVLKPNELECARALGRPDGAFSEQIADEAVLEQAAMLLGEQTSSSVCLTLGTRGCLIRKDGESVRVHAIHTTPPIDTVGAGDCFLSAFSLALAAGATNMEAGVIGSLASAVCVKKINTTGSADKDEILSLMKREGA